MKQLNHFLPFLLLYTCVHFVGSLHSIMQSFILVTSGGQKDDGLIVIVVIVPWLNHCVVGCIVSLSLWVSIGTLPRRFNQSHGTTTNNQQQLVLFRAMGNGNIDGQGTGFSTLGIRKNVIEVYIFLTVRTLLDVMSRQNYRQKKPVASSPSRERHNDALSIALSTFQSPSNISNLHRTQDSSQSIVESQLHHDIYTLPHRMEGYSK